MLYYNIWSLQVQIPQTVKLSLFIIIKLFVIIL